MPRLNPLRKIISLLKELYFIDLPNIKVQIIKSLWILIMKNETYISEII